MNKNLNLCLFALLILSSCNSEPELIYEFSSDQVEMRAWKVQRIVHDPKSTSKGDNMVNAMGDLEYIIKNSFNPVDADLNIDDLSKRSNGYKIEMKTRNGAHVDAVINQALADWLSASDFEVLYGLRDEEIFVLEIENEDLLMEQRFISTNGVSSRSTTKGNSLKVDGTIDFLISRLHIQDLLYPIEISISDEIKSLPFSFELNRDDKNEDLIQKLRTKYGLSITKEIRQRKVLSIK